MKKERITIEDSMLSAITKMAEGNLGAMNACVDLLMQSEKIDPANILGGLGHILNLDSVGIYGTDIYVFLNDICENNIAKMIAVLKAVQIGLFDGTVLADACHRQDYSGREMIPVDELYTKIKEKFEMFDKYEN